MLFKRSRRHVRSQNAAKPKTTFSYYSKRSSQSEAKKPRGARRKLNIWKTLLRLPIYLAIIAIVLCVGYILTLSSSPRIIILNQSKLPDLRPATDYSQAAQNLLKSSIVNLTKITINTKKIETELKNHFPELSKVALTLPIMGRRPVIKIEVAKPVLMLRSDNIDYVLSGEGRAIITANDAQAALVSELPVVNDEAGLDINLGDKILTGEEVSFINEIFAQFRAKNLIIEELILPLLPSELQVKIKGVPYFVKFDLLGNSKTQIGSFFAVKQRLKVRKITPQRYIDVRVEGKAYYK